LGAGCETIRVVERAQEERQKSEYDQIWVVFDKDDFPSDDFNQAVFMAERLGFGVAYSNQALSIGLFCILKITKGEECTAMTTTTN